MGHSFCSALCSWFTVWPDSLRPFWDSFQGWAHLLLTFILTFPLSSAENSPLLGKARDNYIQMKSHSHMAPILRGTKSWLLLTETMPLLKHAKRNSLLSAIKCLSCEVQANRHLAKIWIGKPVQTSWHQSRDCVLHWNFTKFHKRFTD